MKKVKIKNGKYTTYKDEQSLGETHDMIVKALPGQSYIKETMHKVSTTQVTGEALKKVSVGGKGGFGSQGDAREQEKQVDVTSRVMVMCGPSQQAFDHNVANEFIVKGFTKRIVPYTGHEDWVPNVVPNKPRDYDEFAHSNELDPSDYMRKAEEFLSGEALEEARDRYDKLCGYRGAHKYIGRDGYEHRRYTITIVNTLNRDTKKEEKEAYKGQGFHWFQEMPHQAHNNNGGKFNPYSDNKRSIQFMMWQFDQMKEWIPQTRIYEEPIKEPSKEFLELKDTADAYERKRRFEAFKKAPDLSDWKIVYKWELTKQGKSMFNNK